MRRLPFAIAAALAVAGVTVALVLLLRGAPATEAQPLGKKGYAAQTSVRPRSHHFGESVVARLEVLVDRGLVDPERVAVLAEFAPFTIRGEPRRTRTDHGALSRLRFEYALECLIDGCVPETLVREVGLEPAILRHGGDQLGIVNWPNVTVASRVGGFVPSTDRVSGGAVEVPWRATLRVQPPTYSFDPRLLTALLVAAALALIGASLLFVQQAFPGTPLGFRRLRRLRLTPLERALIVLDRAHDRGVEEEQRLALDRLADELRTGGEGQLAGTASRLAWEEDVPQPDRTAALSDRVRAVIDGRSNGRS